VKRTQFPRRCRSNACRQRGRGRETSKLRTSEDAMRSLVGGENILPVPENLVVHENTNVKPLVHFQQRARRLGCLCSSPCRRLLVRHTRANLLLRNQACTTGLASAVHYCTTLLLPPPLLVHSAGTHLPPCTRSANSCGTDARPLHGIIAGKGTAK
jgi:hypothetical protein